MPRYRYRQVIIASPRLSDRTVELKRLGDAVAVLSAIGEGSITLVAADHHCKDISATVPIKHLQGKNEEAIWWLFDGEVDVGRATEIPPVGRVVKPSAHGRWPGCTQDIRNMLDGMDPASVYRLRHFGALMQLGESFGDHIYSIRLRDRIVIDTRLTELEKTIAFRADLNSATRDLCYLR